MTTEATRASWAADLVLGGLAAGYFLLLWLPSFGGHYGYFIDELYYVACSERLDFGYVDHPPLSVWLLRVVRSLIGDSLPALRLIPSLAGAATIWITGLIARRLGASVFGQGLAAGGGAVGGLPLVIFGFYSMNALSILIWAICLLILVEIERRDEPRLWLAFGAMAGLGLQNKHTIVLLALGLTVGLLLTPARRHFASRWLWIGVAVAAMLVLPNLIWQQAHDWASLEFYRSADSLKNLPTPALEVLKQQVLFLNPPALAVWLGGLVFFLATERGRPYRHLGWIYVALLALMLVGQKSRLDRILGAYSILFAGGGVLVGELVLRPRLRWLRLALPAAIVAGGLVFAPLGLPLLPPETTGPYGQALGIVPQIERGEGKRTALPQWLSDRIGWEQLVDDVADAVETLSPEERSGAIIFAPSYGHAGAIELLGRDRDLPPVYSSHNSYFLWGPPQDPIETAIVMGVSRERVEQLYSDVELFRVYQCEWCTPWRDDMPIWIARGQKVDFGSIWPSLKSFV